MNLVGRPQRVLGIGLMLVMAAVAMMGYSSTRRDVENLKVISQDNILWTATQMEVELLRFKLSLAQLALENTEDALDEAKERFDILASELLGQVAVTYASPQRLVPAEKITIAATRDGLTARGVPVRVAAKPVPER